MKRKEYEREMKVLHGELVAMREWVKAAGAKICVVLEGRDTAGKGGTIKRIMAPWYIAHTDDKKRGRLNIISHLLSQVPYKPLDPRDVTLPKRQPARGYTEPDLPLRHIPTPF